MYDDVRQHQRRSDGYIIIKNDCISFREAIAELCVSCTSRSLTFCMSECLHELCVSYINVSDDKCVGAAGRTSCEEWFIICSIINIKLRNFGIKIGFKMGVSGCKSDNLHPYRVESIDKGLYLEAVSGCNR